MRSIFWGLPVVAALTCLGCAPVKAAKVEDPNWRPTSMPVDKTRDTRAPQWVDVPAGDDLIAPENVTDEPPNPKGEAAPEEEKGEAAPEEEKGEAAPEEEKGEAASEEEKGEAAPEEEKGEAAPPDDKG